MSKRADLAPAARSVALVSLGCARNDVDSEELAGRLQQEGWRLVEDPGAADVALVNTCGFVEQAKKDSIDEILAAADLKVSGRTRAVVAVGCLAERYGEQLAAELPEADAVLGFDSYTDMSAHLRGILAGALPASHTPRDRRRLLPLSPARRRQSTGAFGPSGHAAGSGTVGSGDDAEGASAGAPASGPRVVRARLDGRPWAPLKIAGGCDRRCAFCAIPAFRGAFLSRRPTEVLAEARWLAERGVREVFLVSENSTSYGKDLGDLRLLETLLPELAAVEGIERVRVSYLQPAEMRPGLVEVMTGTPGVVPYFDLSFQHASGPLLRRMRRFGDRGAFLDLIASVRAVAPEAGIRSNVIVGFPGEAEEDLAELLAFVEEARLDVLGVFGYSDEDGTEAAGLEGKLDEHLIAERAERVRDLGEEIAAQRAEDRVGTDVGVLLEEWPADEPGVALGRAAHQGPEVDGLCRVLGADPAEHPPGTLLTARVVAADGIDLDVAPA